MANVLVIGGGAAGMAAAIAAAMCGDRVTLLERMDRVGKKLLATGNGRCNLMNVDEPRFPGGESLARAVLEECGVQEQTAFWQLLGLRLRQEDGGRVYPVSGQASSVLDCLRMGMARFGADVVTGVQAEQIGLSRPRFAVYGSSQRWSADRVIVAGGGMAQPKLGSNGSAWQLLQDFHHTLVPPRPSLTQMVTDTAPIRGLSGIRVRCSVAVKSGSRTLHAETGEALFADYGVSGVCVMQCARYARPGTTLHLNLTEGMGFAGMQEVRDELFRRRKQWADLPAEMLLTGLCVPRVAQALCHAAQLPMNSDCFHLSNRQLDNLAQVMADFTLEIRQVKGFDMAQVTAGGLDVREFDPRTLESRLCPGLHAAGEMLDVDGDCGGFNLMFAFGSGILAGLNGRKQPWR